MSPLLTRVQALSDERRGGVLLIATALVAVYALLTIVSMVKLTAFTMLLFAGAQLAPGRLIADTPYEEQVALIHASIDKEHARLIARAGLD